MTELPTHPAELLRLALGDMKKCEADDRYVIDMNLWHEAFKGNRIECHVCLAGSVLAQSIKINHNESLCLLAIEQISNLLGVKVRALNWFREGLYIEGLELLGYTMPEVHDTFPLKLDSNHEYVNALADNRPRFYADMEALAKWLEAAVPVNENQTEV
jgi:hypothetical protein